MRRLFTILSVTMLSTLAFAAPWDFLRPVVEATQSLNVVISAVVMLAALVLAVIAAKAMQKHPTRKLKLVFAAFGLFFVKLLLNFMDIYISPGTFMNNSIMSTFDLAILACLFVAIFRK